MAEKLFLHAIQKEPEPIRSLKAISAGISAFEGSPPSHNAIIAIKDCGLNLNSHKSRPLTQDIIDQSLAIFCMSEVHLNLIKEEFQIDDHPLYLLRDFLPPPHNNDVHDPFGQNLEAYKNCRDSIAEAIPTIIQFLKTKLLPS